MTAVAGCFKQLPNNKNKKQTSNNNNNNDVGRVKFCPICFPIFQFPLRNWGMFFEPFLSVCRKNICDFLCLKLEQYNITII